MLKKEIIDRLIENSLPSVDEILNKYPKRNLKDEAIVSRIAPSPTGFVHIGSLFTAMVNERLAHKSSGVFFMRLEDTDKKREVEGSLGLIVDAFIKYGINFDEGLKKDGEDIGDYGPYKQSLRKDIYKVFIRDLLIKGLAYPCFATQEELEEMRELQNKQKARPGYYGEYAKWRFCTEDEIINELDNKTPFVIRFRSPGNPFKKIEFVDVLKGKVIMAENDIDIVIQKQDGLPTYHFAHLVDDYLMGTTHVIRGDEWLASTPLHIQLFESMGWNPPKYAHIAPIQKIDNGNKRKLSKRKDNEASVSYYDEVGYSVESVIEYMLNLANSDFEDWRKKNPLGSLNDFPITFEKLKKHSGGALFDFVKLDSISKEVISKLSAEEIYIRALDWGREHSEELFDLLEQNKDYTIKILSIERTQEKSRKDISKWNELHSEISYFYDNKFSVSKEEKIKLSELSKEKVDEILKYFKETFSIKDTKEEWFEKIKDICPKIGFTANMKDYKNNPNEYEGNLAQLATTLRIFITGRTRSPDLYEIIQVMGEERVLNRLK